MGNQQPDEHPTKAHDGTKYWEHRNRDNYSENDTKHAQISFLIKDNSCLFDELGMIIIAQTKKGA